MDQEDKFQWQASFGILIVFFIDYLNICEYRFLVTNKVCEHVHWNMHGHDIYLIARYSFDHQYFKFFMTKLIKLRYS